MLLSNQSTISLKGNPKVVQKDSISFFNFKNQLAAILQQMDLPVSVYAATGQGAYRKPRTGMLQETLRDHDLEGSGMIDMNASFYVEDAADREKTSK